MSDIWIFTFGLDHPFRDCIQPIIGDYEQARNKMFQIYGSNWCSQRNISEIDDINVGRQMCNLKPYKLLPEVNIDVEM